VKAAPPAGDALPGPTVQRRTEPGAARPVKRALQLLLEKPELAEQVQQVELLAQADAPGIDMLVEAIDFFHGHPEARASQLLEFWRDTPKSAALERLLSQELNLKEEAIQAEFLDAIALLTQKARRARVQHLLAQARVRPLTDGETREIEAITRELSTRSPD
jgi:DNA primase